VGVVYLPIYLFLMLSARVRPWVRQSNCCFAAFKRYVRGRAGIGRRWEAILLMRRAALVGSCRGVARAHRAALYSGGHRVWPSVVDVASVRHAVRAGNPRLRTELLAALQAPPE
jgi:hypothetical protein